MDESSKVEPTPLIWLVPIFLGLLGGILTYIALKDHSQEKANYAIEIGLYSTLVVIALSIMLWIIVMKSASQMMMPF